MRFLRLQAFAFCCLTLPVSADPGHEIRIEDLNRQITENPAVADLYYQRAVNYREIARLADCRADFLKALELNPAFLPADRELARLDDQEGHRAEGIARLQKAIAAAQPEAAFHLPGAWSALADLLLKEKRNEEALEAAKKGIALTEELTIDLYLFRAEAQRRLGRHEERVKDLAGAVEKLKSFVLRIAWIEALIDAGHSAEVLPEIQKEIDSSRYKASWLIRRARVYVHDGRKTEAAADLEQALAEIETRIRPERPDLSLVCDRALIHALQGKRAEAAATLEDAKAKGADHWMTRILEAELERPAAQ